MKQFPKVKKRKSFYAVESSGADTQRISASNESDVQEYGASPILWSSGSNDFNGYISDNRVKLVHAGREYFKLLEEMINTATDNIHLQTYIYDEDETGSQIANALIAASKRNVQVYVMADGYASQGLSRLFIQKLKDGGVNFRFFEPLFKSGNFYFGRRLHHKLAVADFRQALVGGINISDRYNDMPGKPAWLDFALYVEGEICKDLCTLCWKTWEGFAPKNKDPFFIDKHIVYNIRPEEDCLVRMRRNDWVRNKNQISRSYLEMFHKATSYITIISSYFLPGRMFRRYMAYAAEHGVKIKVVLTSNSDVKLAKQAERYMYRWLLKNKVEIYEYKPNVLHGKLAVFDDQWLTAGSYNVNNISAFASIELNLDIKNEHFATVVNQMIDKIIRNDCGQITEDSLKNYNAFQRIWQKICSDIVGIIFYLFTFYFKHKR